MISNSDIRARARATLGGSIFKSEWLYALVVCLVVSAISGALAFTGVGTILVAGILYVASAAYFLGRVRNSVAHDSLSACIDGVKNDLGGALILGVLHTLFIALWTLLFIIPGIVKSFSYAMAFYIKCDHPAVSATDAITMSRRMMKGYKGKYFCLQLSFFGWMIVGALCFGIGTLWVNAYVSAANAAFYEELKRVNPVELPAYARNAEVHYTVSDAEPQSDAANNGEANEKNDYFNNGF